MKYSIFSTDAAETAIVEYLNYIGIDQQAPVAASRMLLRIMEAKQSLATFPHRCSVAPESEHYSFEVRMLRIASCLLLFKIDEGPKRVIVIGFRHGRQLPLEDLGDDI